MKCEIHFTYKDSEGDEFNDSIIISGDSIEEIQELALIEVKRRQGYNCWSEEVQ